MARYWDDRAQENALWYVDTSLDYDHPDMDHFLATGWEILREALLDAPVQPATKGVAVEIGCGVGRICRALTEQFEQVIGIDISETMVARARQLVPSARFEVGTDLSAVADDSADFVTSFTVFQHMPRAALIDAYVAEAGRVLRSGGVFAAQWNNLPHPWRWKARGVWWRLRHRVGGRFALDQRVAPQFVGMRLPFDDMADMVRRAGLEVQATAKLGTLYAWVWATKP
ncbi:MAG TPA: class I SAM-dependent methyltransferase [Acidimicrobiales bacterium]|nr:class I SAM-dependent methyltransferase [Acidimicrobiales bacterium]